MQGHTTLSLERDRLIRDAVSAGKITPRAEGEYREAWDRAPRATRALLASLGAPTPKPKASLAEVMGDQFGVQVGSQSQEVATDRELDRVMRGVFGQPGMVA